MDDVVREHLAEMERSRQFRIRRCGCGEERAGGRWIRIHWCARHNPLPGW